MKLHINRLEFQLILIIIFLSVSCSSPDIDRHKQEMDKRTQAVINNYLAPQMDSDINWEFVDLKYSKNYETALTDSVILNLAAQIMVREDFLRKYSNFLQMKGYSVKEFSFSLLDSLEYEKLKKESIDYGFDLKLISLIQGQCSELYDKIRILGEGVSNAQYGEIADATLCLSDSENRKKTVRYIFLISPDGQNVKRFYRNDDGCLPVIHKIITDALGDNY